MGAILLHHQRNRPLLQWVQAAMRLFCQIQTKGKEKDGFFEYSESAL